MSAAGAAGPGKDSAGLPAAAEFKIERWDASQQPPPPPSVEKRDGECVLVVSSLRLLVKLRKLLHVEFLHN